MARESRQLARQEICHFRDRFRAARETAQKDAENFHAILFELERLGGFLSNGRGGGLGDYTGVIGAFAKASPLGTPEPNQRAFHVPFNELYESVRIGRNTAMHEGVYARNLTQHTIQLSIVIEDALNRSFPMPTRISDFMVRNPVCAEMWQPLSFIRQNMLANSFTCLPVHHGVNEEWQVVCDLSIVEHLAPCESWKQRATKLNASLSEALASGLKLSQVESVRPEAAVPGVMKIFETCKTPMVLITDDEDRILGLLTPFDLL